jgi:hypothetical protein
MTLMCEKVLRVFLAVAFSIPFLLLQFGCGTRVDILGVLQDASLPDINIKIGENIDIPDGSGVYDFGTLQVETHITGTFTIENTGLNPLTVESILLASVNGGQFTVIFSAPDSVINAQSSASFSIRFQPSSEGYASATVAVKSDDPDEPSYTFTVEGYGSPIPVADIVLKKDGIEVPNGSMGNDFGTVLIGDSSEPAYFSIENTGTDTLLINSIIISSGAQSDYFLDDSTTSYTLLPEEVTSFSLHFSPSESGQRTATVVIENNDSDENPYTFTLTGQGEPKIPDLYVRIGANEVPHGTVGFDFGTVKVGDMSTPLTITLGNRGTDVLYISGITSTDPGQFSVDTSETLFILPPGDTQTSSFTLTFGPSGPYGFKSSDITVESNDPDTFEYLFTVVGYASPIPVPDITVRRDGSVITPGSLGYDFGPVEIGDSSPHQVFTVENSGDANLTVTIINSSSTNFSIQNAPSLPCTIPSGGTDTFSVIFSPDSMDPIAAEITIVNSDPDDNIFSFVVEGETALPEMRITKGGILISNGATDAHDFGTVLEGESSSPVVFTIQNNGDSDLLIGSISFSSGDTSDFTLDDSSTDTVVPAGGNTSFGISFTPAGSGVKSVTPSIDSSDPWINPYLFTVSGEGEPRVPDMHIQQGSTDLPSGSTYGYGTVLIGSSSSAQFSIRNYGTGDLTVYDIQSSSGEFELIDAPSMPSAITPGGSRYFTIRFSPSSPTDRWATITVQNDDPDGSENPYTFTVGGYGETPVSDIHVRQDFIDLPNGSGIHFFGHVQEGDTKTDTFTIENSGTASLIISGILVTDGDTDQFLIDYSIPPIGPGSSSTFDISFSPTYPGDKWAEITIISNDPDEDLYTFRVEGMVGLPPVVDIEVWVGATLYPDGSTYSDFEEVPVGSSSTPAVFTIWNNGPDDLLIPSIVITGGNVSDFDLNLNSTDLNTYIFPGWSTTFSVTFSPQSAGSKWLEIAINYNDPVVTPYTLRLEGTTDD